MPPLARRLTRAAVGWVLVLGLTTIAVHPERCGRPSDEELTDAAQRAVDWFAANIDASGDFVYRYDRDRSTVEPGYNDTRHAGVLWSLWQAERAGLAGAGATAERGFARVEQHLVATPIGPAFGEGATVASGATALLIAALDERRLATGATDRDALLRALGHTLVGVVNHDGSVSADISITDGPGEERSPFFTGEVLWALARLHIAFPDQGFDEPALRVRRYLVEDRDAAETPWPPVSDHWAAYAFETMSRWPQPPMSSHAEQRWLDRQLALFGLQVRYESQRTGGLTTVTRGTIALAAGVGTLGEGLGNHLLHLIGANARPHDLPALVDRADCAAHLLVERQVTDAETTDDLHAARTTGAWFRLGDTQMDDQQHGLSALLLLRRVRSASPTGHEATS